MNIGLNEIKELSDGVESIEIKPKKQRIVKLSYTDKEFREYSTSIEVLTKIATTEDFTACIQKLYPFENPGTVKSKLINPIIDSISKIQNKKDKPKSTTQKNEDGFFVKKHNITDKYTKLYNIVKESINDGDLKYDPKESTCIVDAKFCLKKYFEKKNLKNDGVYELDGQLKNIVPQSTQNVKNVDTVMYRSLSNTIAKELIGWVSQSK